MQLRPYQEELVNGARRAFRKGKRSVVLVASTGAGKSAIIGSIAHGLVMNQKRVLIMAHRTRLITQLEATLSKFGLSTWRVSGAKKPKFLCMIGMVETVRRRLGKLPEPDYIVVDECFPAGTMVDGTPIQDVRVGDYVRSFDESSGKISYNRVNRVFRKKPNKLVEVFFSDGRRIVATPNHPFLTGDGWRSAETLNGGVHVFEDPLRIMQEYNVLRGKVKSSKLAEVRSNLLLKGLSKDIPVQDLIGENVQNKPEACLGPNDCEQPDASRGCEGSYAGNSPENEPPAPQARRERERADCSPARIIRRIGGWMGYGIHPEDKGFPRGGPKPLQDRYSQRAPNDCDRSGWVVTSNACAARAGRSQDKVSGTIRVESIEVHERAGFGGFGELCPDGYVYNLEVDHNHTYFANGLAVHNCHHSSSSQYTAVIAAYPNAKVIGVTATPSRTDGKGLGEVFEEMVVGPAMDWLIENGFLAPYRYFMVPSHIDLDQIRRDAKTGDYKEADAANAVRMSHVVGDAIQHYRKYLGGKTGIVFCTGVDHAKEVAAEFDAAGIRSEAIDGTMPDAEQDRLMNGLASGEIKLLMSADLIGEGVDVPSINGVIMLRPTQSVVIFLQQVGRALRIKPDGSTAIILDHVQNAKRHGMPCDPRAWSLESVQKKKGEICTRQCSECQRVFNAFTAKEDALGTCANEPCPVAQGISRPIADRVTEIIDENLVEAPNPWAWAGGIEPTRAMGIELKDLIAKADTEEKLKQIARARGYDKGWWIRQAELKGLRKRANRFWKKGVAA